jgi:hypothetical protein
VQNLQTSPGSSTIPNKKYIFAGFNALSKAELQIIKNLKKSFLIKV